MKLQPALIFGQNMILQRGIPIPVWGRSVRDDTVTVVLNASHTGQTRGLARYVSTHGSGRGYVNDDRIRRHRRKNRIWRCCHR